MTRFNANWSIHSSNLRRCFLLHVYLSLIGLYRCEIVWPANGEEHCNWSVFLFNLIWPFVWTSEDLWLDAQFYDAYVILAVTGRWIMWQVWCEDHCKFSVTSFLHHKGKTEQRRKAISDSSNSTPPLHPHPPVKAPPSSQRPRASRHIYTCSCAWPLNTLSYPTYDISCHIPATLLTRRTPEQF